MDSPFKSRSGSIYGALLRAYPSSFRKHYAATMLQTFADMLADERSSAGRMRVWARTLADLPRSAAKEHVTNGREVGMNRTAKCILGAAVLAIIIVGLGSFWFGNLHARRSIGVEHVTPAQLADAMRQDHFYSSYGNAAVLFTGKVSSVTRRTGVTLVTFITSRPYGLTCQFPKSISAKTGQALSVAAPAGSAEREPHGVLLHNCVES